jgi:acetyl-CoA C-acetyltransferase
MGLCGEKCAGDYEISRELSDEYAQRSYEKAIAAKAHHAEEIVPVHVSAGKGLTVAVTVDEGPNNVCLDRS